MSTAATDVLWEYALGSLGGAERAALEAELDRSPALERELAEIRDIACALGTSAAPVEPSAAVRERLLAGIERERFAPFVERLTRLFDLGRERVQEVLRAVDDAASGWVDGPFEGFSALHFAGGPRAARADCGLVRLKPGTHFPHHRHFGEERAIVLQGAYRDLTDGTLVRAGDTAIKPPGSIHHYRAEPGEDLVFAVSIVEGIELVSPSGESLPTEHLYSKKK